MRVVLNGENLTIEQVQDVARNYARVEIAQDVREKVNASHELVLKLVERGEVLYGITTGIGEFAKVRIDREQSCEMQKRIIRSHAACTGNIIPEDHVRAIMLLRANVMAKGYSGARYSTLQTIVDMINKNAIPVTYEKGSLGASGDLSSLAMLSLVVIGEGEAFYKGRRMPGKEAMDLAGIKIVDPTYKEALALINGTQMFTGLGALLCKDAEGLIKNSQIACGMTIDALKGMMKAFDPRLHALRPFPGQNAVAANIRRLTEESEIIADDSTDKVQDGYSLRCTGQILGPALDTLKYVREQVTIEMNSAADNPLFIAADEEFLTGGNFHGQSVAAAMDYLAIPMTTLCGFSERHINRLLNSQLSGLPDFLVGAEGLNSGLMIVQYTAAALASENKVYAHPASVDSIPVSADQEDYVSMGAGAALKLRQVMNNAASVIALHLMCAAQAVDFRSPLKPGKGTAAAYKEIRKQVEFLKDDRPLYPDIDTLTEMVRKNTIADAVEREIGSLEIVW
ncbi:MAG: histidine ammonia-lyase [Armatimonadota bacterium]